MRDLDEMRDLGFNAFAAAPIVSHAYVQLVDVGNPVRVGGVVVRPGDLLHADQHGVIIIPQECAKQVAAAAAEVEARERPLINYWKSSEFTLDGLKSCGRSGR